MTAAQVGVPLNKEIVIKYEAQPIDFYEAIPYIVELIKKTMAQWDFFLFLFKITG